jgi:hypothetical protein
METLSAIGMVILIIIGILIVVLLGYALRLLLTIYSMFTGTRKESEEEKGNKLLGFVKSAGVIEIIMFLLRNRGRFKR